MLLGIVRIRQEDLREARAVLEQALATDPESADAAFWLAGVYRRQGLAAEALATAEQAARLDPAREHAQNQLGMCLLDSNRPAEAAARFEAAIRLNPRVGSFHDNLGRALQAVGRNAEAIEAFQRVLAIGPVRPPALYRLGDAFMQEANPVGAERCARTILQMEPSSLQGTLLLARALIGDGRVQEGAEWARRAAELAPENAVPEAYYGRALQSLGQIAEAEKHFKRSIELEPRQGFAYHALVHNHRVTEDERPMVVRMQELTGDPGLPRREVIQLEYGLGKALEDLGEYEAAMRHFDEANRIDHELKAGAKPFSKDQLQATADFLISTFTPAFFALHGVPIPNQGEDTRRSEPHQSKIQNPNSKIESSKFTRPTEDPQQSKIQNPKSKIETGEFTRRTEDPQQSKIQNPKSEIESSEFIRRTEDPPQSKIQNPKSKIESAPIFVVGMMRSGTTLAEQILSSHPDVGGAGELLFWPENAGSSEKIFSRSGELDAIRLTELASAYRDLLAKLAPGKRFVVDKMNTNYLLLGLLHLAFPDARIVHMKRHPVDTCLSIWATPVARDVDLCGDKANVVFAYRQYLRIMDHWRSVLPADRLLDVQYEELVSNREQVTRNMIEFCGLEWDEACMRPEDNVRSVKTPSVWQVRQPVYKTSMARWKKYEPWLGPFAELFDTI